MFKKSSAKLFITKQVNDFGTYTRTNGYFVHLDINGQPSIWDVKMNLDEAIEKGKEWTTLAPIFDESILEM